MSRYETAAVDALHTQVSAQLATQLAAVETDEGIAAGSLTQPISILKNRAPNDNISPLMRIYSDGAGTFDQRNHLYVVDCIIDLGYKFPTGTDLAALELFMRRYLDAMRRCVLADQTLGGAACQALIEEASDDSGDGDTSETRRVATLAVIVTVHSPP